MVPVAEARTSRAGSVSQAAASSRTALTTRRAVGDSGQALAPRGAGSTAGAQFDVSQPHTAATIGILLAGVMDPMALLAGLQSAVREAGSKQSEQEMRTDKLSAAASEALRTEALANALKLAEKASSGAPPWLKKLITAIVTIVAVAASLFTGGASLALVVVALVLMVAAKTLEVMAKNGVIDPKRGGIAALCIKVVAAVVMAVASLGTGSSALASAAGEVAQGAVEIAKMINQVVIMVKSACDMRRTRLGLESANYRLDAEELAVAIDDANMSVEDAVRDMADIHQQYGRAMQRLSQMVELGEQAQQAATRSPA